MTRVGDAIRSHHRELMNTLAAHAEALADGRPEADLDGLLAFLKQDLLPHATGEEQHMYGLLDSLIKENGRPTETMRIDHRAIEDYTQQIEKIIGALPSATNAELTELEERLKRVATQLEAVVALHLYKEEEALLPLFEEHLTVEEQDRVLEGMHEAASELDVRRVPPPRRHGLIFQTFDNLKPGASFTLINDHDPKPLFYQFNAEHPGAFTWEYEERGPGIWRVRIGKVA